MSTRRVDSSTPGRLIRTPSCAPRPVPTSSAVGVARPSAQGQAMISTATAAANARPVSPRGEPEAERRGGDREHDGHEDRRDAVGEPLDRRLARLRVGDEPADLRERGVGADARRAHDQQAAADVDGRAGDRVAGVHVDRHALAGQQRAVDRRVALVDDTVGRDLLARPHDEAVADLQLVDGTRRSTPSASSTTTSAAPSSSSARSAAPARRLARASNQRPASRNVTTTPTPRSRGRRRRRCARARARSCACRARRRRGTAARRPTTSRPRACRPR